MRGNISSKKLTVRYAAHQMFFFSITAGISAFAATYLLEKGFNTSQIGTLLAVSNLLACVVQPLIGDVIDRLSKFVLPQILALIFTGVIICFAVIQFFHPPIGIFGLLYGTGVLLSSITNSLNNSLCAYYSNRNYPINYGVGLGIGSLSFSFASLGYGYIMALLGVDWMVWIVLMLSAVLTIITLGYPGLSTSGKEPSERSDKTESADERVSIWKFFGKYKMFTFTMSGVLLVAMCHSMTENYFIAIFQNIGGGSENVGIAMFVACLSAVPYFMFFEKIREKISIFTLLKLAGIFFIIKIVLLILTTEIWHVYAIQLLQTFTYGFLYQPLYYMTRQRISEADLAKGQAVTVALYTLGTAFGSFVGGRVIDILGVSRMLWLALAIAVTGTTIIHISLIKTED